MLTQVFHKRLNYLTFFANIFTNVDLYNIKLL